MPEQFWPDSMNGYAAMMIALMTMFTVIRTFINHKLHMDSVSAHMAEMEKKWQKEIEAYDPLDVAFLQLENEVEKRKQIQERMEVMKDRKRIAIMNADMRERERAKQHLTEVEQFQREVQERLKHMCPHVTVRMSQHFSLSYMEFQCVSCQAWINPDVIMKQHSKYQVVF